MSGSQRPDDSNKKHAASLSPRNRLKEVFNILNKYKYEEGELPPEEHIATILSSCEQLIKENSRDNGVLITLGDLYYQAGDYKNATLIYHKASELGEVEAFKKLADAYRIGSGVAKNELMSQRYEAEYYLRFSKIFFEAAEMCVKYYPYSWHDGANQFKMGVDDLKKGMTILPHTPIPDKVFAIMKYYVADFLKLARDEKIGSLLKKDKRATTAIDGFFSPTQFHFYMMQNLETQEKQKVLFSEVIKEAQTGNELAIYFLGKLKKALKNNYKNGTDMDQVSKEMLNHLIRIEHESKDHKRAATYTSSVSSPPSFGAKIYNFFFNRKHTKLMSAVKAQQQAMNDSDPEELGPQVAKRQGRRR